MRTAVAAAPRTASPRFRNALFRLLGWRALLLQQDPPTWDRWCWVRDRLPREPVRILDAGSGSGAFVIAAARLGHDTLGLSLDPVANMLAGERAARLRLPRARFRTADLRSLHQFGSELGQFDLILCLETIEHLADDTGLLTGLAARLQPGGTLLLTTPSAEHRPLLGESVSEIEDGGHVRYGYSLARLGALLEGAGLRPVSVDHLSGVISQRLTDLARWLAERVGVHEAWALTAPLRPLLLLDSVVTRMLGYPWLALAVVAEKP